MSVRSMKRRLAEVRRAGQGEEIGKIVIIRPDDWPEDVQDAYDRACAAGDVWLQADIIGRQTGERPVYPVPGFGSVRGHLPPAVIEVRYTPDGTR